MERLNIDHNLHMVIEPPCTFVSHRLLFNRWLVENGKGEHLPSGPPAGEIAMAMVVKSHLPIDEAISQALKPRSIKEQIAKTGDY